MSSVLMSLCLKALAIIRFTVDVLEVILSISYFRRMLNWQNPERLSSFCATAFLFSPALHFFAAVKTVHCRRKGTTNHLALIMAPNLSA